MSRTTPPYAPTSHVLASTLRATNSYPTTTEPRLLYDTLTTTRHYPTLHPIIADYTTRQLSKPQRLLALRGTIPISYKGAQYLIPVHIWLMPYFPDGPPIALVVPTSTMTFRKRHPHVDIRNGMVYLPYLAEWSSLSTLPAFVDAMATAFSTKPPVYTRVASTEPLRLQLIAALSSRLHLAFVDASDRAIQMSLLRNASQRLLEERREKAARVQHTIAEMKRLQHLSHSLKATLHSMRQWVMLHPPALGDVDLDTRPRHALREQEVTSKARDWAISDAMDVLDECVVRKLLSGGEFIERLRPLARDQFFARLMARNSRAKLIELKQRAKRKQPDKQGAHAT